MRQITGHSLWIGDRGDVRDLPALRAGGIAAVVDLAIDEPLLAPPRDLVYLRYPLLDGAGNSRCLLAAAVGGVASLVRARAPSLVVCSGGMSRAPAIASAGVAVATGRKVDAVLEQIARAGGPVDLSSGLWRGVCAVVVGLQVGRPN